MKQKTKKITVNRTRKQLTVKRRNTIPLAHSKRPGLRHFRLIEHKYSFRLVHHRHTSHVGLTLILVIVGFFLYASSGLTQAQTTGESILVGAIVPGPAPTKGAVINLPKDGDLLTDRIITIKGTCENNSFVIIRDNDLTIGSTSCQFGSFSIQAQLQYGKNILSAFNYDNLNQVGPATSKVTVYLSDQEVSEGIKPIDEIPISVLQVIPDNPSIITGVSKLTDCSDYNPGTLPTGGVPHVSIVCVPRLFFPGIQKYVGVLVWGGQPPYALSVNWGKELAVESDEQSNEAGEDTLISLNAPGYKLIQFNYAVPDTYRVQIKLKDRDGQDAIIQTAIQVNGESKTTTTTNTKSVINNIVNEDWFKNPVPMYLLAVAVTLGFWGGDIFDRTFGAKKPRHKKRRTV